MKYLVMFLSVILLFACRTKDYAPLNTINPVIGDESWTAVHGSFPNGSESETERIRTHLQYAEQLLRSKDVSTLTEQQKAKRAYLLDLLAEYHERGIFPKNTKYTDGRRPCFIDDEGTICAVGYLVEQTLGRATAEAINARFQYATIAEMDLTFLTDWMNEYGVQPIELATIQPTYRTVMRGLSYHVGGGVQRVGNNELFAGYHAGITHIVRRQERNFFSAKLPTRDYSMHIQSWKNGDASLGLRAGWYKRIYKNAAINFGGMLTGWSATQGNGSSIAPSIMLVQNLFNIKKFNLGLIADYAYHVPWASALPAYVARHDVGIWLRLTYNTTRITNN